ncbi:MAG: TIGR03619 family F420-dependent LLM class oxidoreductase [Sphingomonadales bacterium]|nr:MAG: TIGR03619 family F420-dependent LLM class oxidoreductase [Sphingomonadales bacterium]
MKFCNMLSFIENDQLINSAVLSEEVGFDSISVSDHIVLPEVINSWYPDTADGKPFFTATTDWTFPEPWVTLAMMAQATSRVQLMQSIYLLAARNPIEVAKSTGTLSVLSGNRLALCCAVGWMKEEFDIYGVDFHSRGRRTDEAIAVLRKMWSGEIVEHHGEFFDFPRLRILPQPGNMPVYVSGPADRVMQRAARIGDGWMSRMSKVEDMPPSLEKLKGYLKEAGRENDPFEVIMVAENPWGLDDVRRAEDMGITQMILLPAFFTLHRKSSFDDKRRYWEDFAETVIRHCPN